MIQKHKAVCFTGHRNSPNTPEMRFYIKNLLEGLIVLDGAKEPKFFFHGNSIYFLEKIW